MTADNQVLAGQRATRVAADEVVCEERMRRGWSVRPNPLFAGRHKNNNSRLSHLLSGLLLPFLPLSPTG
eukprot:scaffold75376_cov33-Phaeocystis_antarctica.AAC.1